MYLNQRATLGSIPILEMKSRLDKLLVDQGHAASRERAQALILAGRVLVNEQRVDKPGVNVPEDAAIRLLGSDLKYVSRGGLKLEHALTHWRIPLAGVHAVDIGASTGGFTDCMLQAGAATVLAVDTGYGQIAQRLRDDPRVSLRERTNARKLEARRTGRSRAVRAGIPGDGRLFHLGDPGAAGGVERIEPRRRCVAWDSGGVDQTAVRGRPRACGQGRYRTRSRGTQAGDREGQRIASRSWGGAPGGD